MIAGFSSSTSSLAQLIEKHAPKDGSYETALPALSLYRSSTTTSPVPSVFVPVICVLAQGGKQLLAGVESFAYTPDRFAIVTTTLPLSGQITTASRTRPYLGLRVQLDFTELHSLLVDGSSLPRTAASAGILLGSMTHMLEDALRRLLQLLDVPKHIPVLGPMLQREIMYLLLQSEIATQLSVATQLTVANRGIAKVIQLLQKDYRKAIHVSDLAKLSQQSESTFHRHFYKLTGLTPLQYQKRLRLQEARRLLTATQTGVGSAAYTVGYESVPHFSRDYRRLYGVSPRKDMHDQVR